MQRKEVDKLNSFRQSNIELLRIVAMLMIVAYHFSLHGGFSFSSDSITVNRLWIQFIQIGGKIGVNVFVLISGYFLISVSEIKTSKLIKLEGTVITYSIIIFIVFVAVGETSFSIKELIKHCFPITFSQWWFASAYFVLYLLSPYINQFLKTLDKEHYRRFIILLGICWCVVPTFTGQYFQSNSLLWFIFLYSIAAYIKLFGFNQKYRHKYGLLIVLLYLLTFASVCIFDLLGTKVSFFAEHATFFFDMQRIPVFVISVLLFIVFLLLNVPYIRLINVLSSAMFGVYLIHDDRYIRLFLWETVFSNASFSKSNALIPYSIFVILMVFVVCAGVELMRLYAIEKRYLPLINHVSNRIDICIKMLLSVKERNN